ELPALNLPEGFEQYDTKSDSKFSKNGTSYKEFEVLLIPRQVGDLTIPAINVSFFNPKTRQFEKRSTQNIALKVVAGKHQVPQGSQGLAFTEKQREKKALPAPVIVESATLLNQKTLNTLWISLTAFSLIFLLGYFVRVNRAGEKRVVLIQEVNRRVTSIQRLQDAKKFREAGVAVINLVQFVMGEMTMDKESHQIDQL